MIPKKRDTFLGEILIHAGLLDETGLERGLEMQKETQQLLGEALVSLGLVSQEDIEWALSSQYQLPFIRPADISVDRACRDRIPEPLARAFNVAPLFRTGNELSVVIDDPLKLEELALLDEFSNLELNIALASASDVSELINDLYGTLGTDVIEASRAPIESSRSSSLDLAPYLRDYTARSFFGYLLRRATAYHASSIVLDPGGSWAEVKIRGANTTHETFSVRPDWYRTLISSAWATTGAAPEDSTTEWREGVGRVEFDGGEVSFTVTRITKPEGASMVIKLPVGAPRLPDLKDLKLPDGATEKIANLLARRQGLWIVTGNTPAATSRILHALLQTMSGPGRRILSLREDSRGYEKLDSFRSLQVLDFVPGRGRVTIPSESEWDGIVLPSLFEKAEIERALRYALTGRVVLASMDFPDPRSAVRFLLCQELNAALVTSSVAGILAQKEIRVLCPHCKERVQIGNNAPVPSRLREELPPVAYRAVGCDVCHKSGFASRDTLLDFWAMDSDLKRILHGPDPIARLDDHGGAPLEDSCLDRYRRGEAVLEDVLAVCEL